jgi:hypothetical protein
MPVDDVWPMLGEHPAGREDRLEIGTGGAHGLVLDANTRSARCMEQRMR